MPANRAHAQRVARLRALIDQAIDHRAGRAAGLSCDAETAADAAGCPHAAAREQQTGLFDILLTAEDPLTRQQLQDEAITLLTGAIETTGTTLAWTLYEISRHPRVEKRLREELATVCGDRPLRYDDLGHLPYARRVLQEAIRKYGPAWLVTRTATRDIDLGGHLVPQGADVVWSPLRFWERRPVARALITVLAAGGQHTWRARNALDGLTRALPAVRRLPAAPNPTRSGPPPCRCSTGTTRATSTPTTTYDASCAAWSTGTSRSVTRPCSISNAGWWRPVRCHQEARPPQAADRAHDRPLPSPAPCRHPPARSTGRRPTPLTSRRHHLHRRFSDAGRRTPRVAGPVGPHWDPCAW
ncbi:cytochrome P450 [Streptomyces sp. DG1A-41]|uniref:cytochrome P450 n=1 Tax=Streptomyces sp. DG1A-41 TaxID=3125779 RepID=UPI0030CF9F8E